MLLLSEQIQHQEQAVPDASDLTNKGLAQDVQKRVISALTANA